MILEGDYSNLDIDDLTCLLLKHLKQKAPLDILPVIIPEVDVAKKFSVWPEKTSTSPSGRHLGHYRALLPREMRKNLKAEEMEACRQRLESIHSRMINLALKNGRSFRRWKKVVNIMLEKDPGNPKIHRLRVIHLYEADYNLILAIQARKLVHYAEDNKLLHDSLYGA